MNDVKQFLKWLKKIIFGKFSPSVYIRILCWLNLCWSIIMIFFYLFIYLLSKTSLSFSTEGSLFHVIKLLDAKPFLVLALLHMIVIFSIVFIWRKKRLGLYVYTIVTLMMPLYLLYFIPFSEIITMLIFSMAMVLLFYFNYNEFIETNSLNKEKPSIDLNE